MKTFKEFYNESVDLLESSISQGSSSRALAPKGPHRYFNFTSSIARHRSDKAALKKAGFRRIPQNQYSYRNKVHDTWNSDEHLTKVSTAKNQTNFAANQLDLKNPKITTPKPGQMRVTPTSKRVSELKALRRQLGGTRTSRPVHSIDISADAHEQKNDPTRLVSRGKSFKQELKGIPKSIERAGGKSGDIVTGKPTATMGNEDPKTGKEKRARLYQRQFGAKLNPRTGLMIGRARIK
jgi:hypothetical protein